MAVIAPPKIELLSPHRMRHIEGFSHKRVWWLRNKVLDERIWTRPLALDVDNNLVLDGQHRMEVAKLLELRCVPVVFYSYPDVRVWSLRPNYQCDWKLVTRRALADKPYPYKTVKHEFPNGGLPECAIPLEELQ